jgi:predicted DsbA family dithiol-disulfide isomerase
VSQDREGAPPPATAASVPTPLRIDIVSDTVCPWCWLGKRQLEHALARRPDLAADVHWHPIQLDPSIPAEGAPHRERLVRKLGGAAALDAAHARLAQMGQAAGLTYAFSRITRTPNTLATHVLVRAARAHGGAAGEAALVERLFAAFFGEGVDLTQEANLIAEAARAGLPAEACRDALADSSLRADVSRDIDAWRDRGVSGVPTFVFAERYAVSGAQPIDTLLQVLARVAPPTAR